MFLFRGLFRYVLVSVVMSCLWRVLFSPGMLMSLTHLLTPTGFHGFEATNRHESAPHNAASACERAASCRAYHSHDRAQAPHDATRALGNDDPNGPLARRYPDSV